MKKTLIAIVLALAAGPAMALNMSGLKDAPITRLTADELKAFRATVMKVLDETPNGTTVEWRAPKTRFVSKITPTRSFSEAGLRCREATIESDAHDRFQRGRYTFCKGAKGDWEFRIPAAAKR